MGQHPEDEASRAEGRSLFSSLTAPAPEMFGPAPGSGTDSGAVPDTDAERTAQLPDRPDGEPVGWLDAPGVDTGATSLAQGDEFPHATIPRSPWRSEAAASSTDAVDAAPWGTADEFAAPPAAAPPVAEPAPGHEWHRTVGDSGAASSAPAGSLGPWANGPDSGPDVDAAARTPEPWAAPADSAAIDDPFDDLPWPDVAAPESPWPSGVDALGASGASSGAPPVPLDAPDDGAAPDPADTASTPPAATAPPSAQPVTSAAPPAAIVPPPSFAFPRQPRPDDGVAGSPGDGTGSSRQISAPPGDGGSSASELPVRSGRPSDATPSADDGRAPDDAAAHVPGVASIWSPPSGSAGHTPNPAPLPGPFDAPQPPNPPVTAPEPRGSASADASADPNDIGTPERFVPHDPFGAPTPDAFGTPSPDVFGGPSPDPLGPPGPDPLGAAIAPTAPGAVPAASPSTVDAAAPVVADGGHAADVPAPNAPTPAWQGTIGEDRPRSAPAEPFAAPEVAHAAWPPAATADHGPTSPDSPQTPTQPDVTPWSAPATPFGSAYPEHAHAPVPLRPQQPFGETEQPPSPFGAPPPLDAWQPYEDADADAAGTWPPPGTAADAPFAPSPGTGSEPPLAPFAPSPGTGSEPPLAPFGDGAQEQGSSGDPEPQAELPSPAGTDATTSASSPPRGGGSPARILGILALVVGLGAVGAAAVPLTSVWAWIPALVAIVLGVIALVRRATPRFPAVAGTVLGPVALAIAVLVSFTAIFDALAGAGTVFAGSTPTPEPTTVATQEPEAPPVPADVVHEGVGSTVLPIVPLDGADQPVVVLVSAPEEDLPLEVWSLGAGGQRLEKLVDTLGPYEGTVAFSPLAPPDAETDGEPDEDTDDGSEEAPDAGTPDDGTQPVEPGGTEASLEILTEGSWTVTIRSIAALETFDAQASGTSDTVLRYDGPGGIATIGYTGTGSFTVRRHTDHTEVLLNTIGAYEGSVDWASGSSLVIVRATGEWSITVA